MNKAQSLKWAGLRRPRKEAFNVISGPPSRNPPKFMNCNMQWSQTGANKRWRWTWNSFQGQGRVDTLRPTEPWLTPVEFSTIQMVLFWIPLHPRLPCVCLFKIFLSAWLHHFSPVSCVKPQIVQLRNWVSHKPFGARGDLCRHCREVTCGPYLTSDPRTFTVDAGFLFSIYFKSGIIIKEW